MTSRISIESTLTAFNFIKHQSAQNQVIQINTVEVCEQGEHASPGAIKPHSPGSYHWRPLSLRGFMANVKSSKRGGCVSDLLVPGRGDHFAPQCPIRNHPKNLLLHIFGSLGGNNRVTACSHRPELRTRADCVCQSPLPSSTSMNSTASSEVTNAVASRSTSSTVPANVPVS